MNGALTNAIGAVAAPTKVTPAQITFAWLAQTPGFVPMAWASEINRLEENSAAADVALTPPSARHRSRCFLDCRAMPAIQALDESAALSRSRDQRRPRRAWPAAARSLWRRIAVKMRQSL
jgi:aryl-alcohol dehydrogenase-like predicted oxidoreductase